MLEFVGRTFTNAARYSWSRSASNFTVHSPVELDGGGRGCGVREHRGGSDHRRSEPPIRSTDMARTAWMCGRELH
jgi:hypothetical protein